jgi:ubiquinone/menaquinone biosynthesis C-methylase UbiE
MYHDVGLKGFIYQDRMAIALQWIEQLRLPSTAYLLEIGCGAGFATAALAMQGYRVDALDSTTAMIDLTTKRLAETGAAERVRIVRGDVRHLPMPNNSFDLVFALGVLPWLDDSVAAVREMARVTRPGGYVLVTADHYLHLDEILDPARAPILRPLRRYLASALRRAKLLSRPQSPKIQRHSRREFDSILSGAGLDKLWSVMLGFGPLTLFGKCILSDSLGIKVHRLLQAAANRQSRIVSFCGMQYLVMSTKRA